MQKSGVVRTVRRRVLGSAVGRLAIAAIIVLTVGTWFYRTFEGWTWLDAFYFCVITLTTIGYGDLQPSQDITKLFTVGYVVVGIGLWVSLINAFATRRIQRAEERAAEHLEQIEQEEAEELREIRDADAKER